MVGGGQPEDEHTNLSEPPLTAERHGDEYERVKKSS